MIRTRTALAATVAAALTLAACGDDDSSSDTAAPASSVADDEMSGDEMSDEEMSDEEMSDEEMSDEEMSDEEMSDEEMSDEEMSDEEMSDEEMSDEEMSDDDMSDDDMSDEEMSDEEMSDDEMSDDDMSMNDVMSRIIERDDLTVLDGAIHAAGLEDALHTGGPFTVFAPTDDAFAAYLGEMGMTADDVFADVDALTLLLQAHVVEGTDDAAMVMEMDGRSFTTLAGNELTVTVDGDAVMVGDASVVEYDITADNGVIHVIDAVLTPPAG